MKAVVVLSALLLAGSVGTAQDRRGPPRSPSAQGYKRFEPSRPGTWSNRGYGRVPVREYRPPYGRYYKTPPYRHYPSYHGYFPSRPHGYRRPWSYAIPRYAAPYWSYYPPYYYSYPCR